MRIVPTPTQVQAVRAYRKGRLDRRMRVYLAPKVLIIDEMGYLPLDDMGATIFFQLVSGHMEGVPREALIRRYLMSIPRAYRRFEYARLIGDLALIP